MEKKSNFDKYCEIDTVIETMKNLLYNYQKMKADQLYYTPQMLKNRQDEIKELCTVIIEKISDF